MGAGSGISAAAVYHRSYAPLKRPLFNTIWRVLTIYASFVAVLLTLPWQTLKALAPGGMKDTLADFEQKALGVLIPFCNYWQDAYYNRFAAVDRWGVQQHVILDANVAKFNRDFETFYNSMFGFFEDRTSLLQDYGIDSFHTLYHAGLSPNALACRAGKALSASRGVATSAKK